MAIDSSLPLLSPILLDSGSGRSNRRVPKDIGQGANPYQNWAPGRFPSLLPSSPEPHGFLLVSGPALNSVLVS